MPNLLKYMGYVDDGVDEFLCLTCKSTISMRGATYNPITYCPYCGTKFEGGYIKDSRYEKRKWQYKLHEKRYKYLWRLEERHLIFFDKNDTREFKEPWNEVLRSYECDDKKELFAERDKRLTEFKNSRRTPIYKEILEIRIVYYKYYFGRPFSESDEIIKVLPAKRVVKRNKKELS